MNQIYYVIKKISDSTFYRIKKGQSSFVESPGFGPSLFSSKSKASGILKAHLKAKSWSNRNRNINIEEAMQDYQIVPVTITFHYDLDLELGRCRCCSIPISSAELCEDCAKELADNGYDPFFTSKYSDVKGE